MRGQQKKKPEGNNEKEIERSRTSWKRKSAINNSEIRLSCVLLDPEVHLISVNHFCKMYFGEFLSVVIV